MVYEVKGCEKIKKIIGAWNETLIWSCLQGIMGHLYVTNTEEPESVMALLGDFCFFAGKPNQELVSYKPDFCKQNYLIMVPESKEWGELIETVYNGRNHKTERYAIKKEKDVFDIERLYRFVSNLPENFELRMINKKLFEECREIFWCCDWVSQYDSYEKFEKYGLGVVLFVDGERVSGASSYSGYIGGIEIEIDTHSDHRRKGYATICGAKLIIECLKRNLYPSWDAQNLWSVALAEKLGYHYERTYTVYEIAW